MGNWIGPIESELGLHWFFVEKFDKVKQLTFEEAQSQIKQDLMATKVKTKKRAIINDLIAQYRVEYEG